MALGSGVNTAAIYDANGVRRLFTIPSQSKVTWGRVLDGISEAHVTAVPPGSGSPRHQECCDLLGRILPWAHCLVVFRDDIRVWEGPVTKVTVSTTEVTVDALDVLGWLKRRPVAERFVDPAASVLVEGEYCLTAGYAEHDPNVLAHRVVLPHGTIPYVTRDVKAASTYYADDLADLVGSGLRYTVLGRRIILWSHTWVLGQLHRLYPSRDLADAVTFARDGLTMATRVVARNDDGEVAQFPASAPDGIDGDYGLVSVIEESGTVLGVEALSSVAAAARATTWPLPTLMQMPDGATLNCEAAFDIRDLVPGMVIPVYEDGLCWSVRQQMVLSELTVTQGPGEDVAITLVPLTEAQAAEGNTVSENVTLTVTDTSSRIWTQISDDGETAVYTSTIPALGGGEPPGDPGAGVANGAIGWAGTASGGGPPQGAATGAVGRVGSSTGQVPGVPPHTGFTEGTNLLSLVNSEFESGVPDWEAFNGASVSASAVHAHYGAQSMRAAWSNLLFPGCQIALSGLTAGRTYTASAWVWVPAGMAPVAMQVWLVGGGDWSGENDTWTRIHLTFVATGTDHLLQILPIGDTNDTQYAWIDTVVVTESGVRREGSATGVQPAAGLAVTLLDSGHDTALNGTTFTTPSAVTLTAGRLYILHVYLSGTGTSPDPDFSGPGSVVEVTRHANLAARSVVSVVFRCTAGGTGTFTWSNSAAYVWTSTIWALEEWTGHDDTDPIAQSRMTNGTSSGAPPAFAIALTSGVTAGNAITAAFGYALAETATVSGGGQGLFDQTETGPVGALTVQYDLAPADNSMQAAWTTAANVRAAIFEIAKAP